MTGLPGEGKVGRQGERGGVAGTANEPAGGAASCLDRPGNLA